MLPFLLLPILLAHEFLEVFHHQLLLVGAQFLAENVVQISLLPLRYVAAFQCFLQGFELSRGEIVLENLLGEVLLLLIQLRMAITRPGAGVIFSAPEINILPRRGVSRAIFGDGVFRSEVAELRVLQPLLAHVIEPWVVSLSEPLLLLPVLLAHEFLEVFHHQLLLVGAQFFAEDVVQISLLPLRYVAAFQRFLQGLELSRGEVVLENLLGEVLLLLIQLRMTITRPLMAIAFSFSEARVTARWRLGWTVLRDGHLRSGAAEF